MRREIQLKVFRKVAALLIFMGVLLWLTPPAQVVAQSNEDILAAMVIGEEFGNNLGGMVNAAQEMRSSSIQATKDIESSRRKYWQAVQSGRGIDAAQKEFSQNLAAKDMYYLMMAIPEGTSGPRNQIINLISGGIDGGIRPSARPEFEHWVKAIRVHLGAETWFDRGKRQPQMVIPNLKDLTAALDSSHLQQMSYVRARNWAEIDASGLQFPWDTDARAYALMLLQRYGEPRTNKEIINGYRELVNLADEQAVLTAAERVRSARRSRSGNIANPEALGIISTAPEAAFVELLASSSGAVFLKYLLWQGASSPEEADQIFNRWLIAYGQENLENAATEIFKLRREDRYKYMGLGLLYRDILELLAKKSIDGYLRAIVAHGEQVKSSQDLNTSLQRLFNKYGKDQVRDVAARLRLAWYTELSTPASHAKEFSPEIRKEWKRQLDRRVVYDQLQDALQNGLSPTLAIFPLDECGRGELPGIGWDRPTNPKVKGGMDALLARLHYPQEDRAARRQGSVKISAFVDATGRVAHASVWRSEGATKQMEKEALKLVRSASFTPGTWEGEPTCTGVTLEVPFRLTVADR